MLDIDPKITVAIITTLGGLIATCITLWVSKKKVGAAQHGLAQAESELKLQQKALDFGAFIEEWSETHRDISHLLQETQLDRFLILRAWNGKLAPRWTTAVFQMRLGEQKPISYVHFELDTDYVSRLKEISIRNILTFAVADLPDCEIKKVYEVEGVKHAVWAHIMSEEVPGSTTVSHTYCSFATRSDTPIDQNVTTRCVILAGRLKGIAANFQPA